MDREVLQYFMELGYSYDYNHFSGSEEGSRIANLVLKDMREVIEQHPELKPVDKAFFAYWYKGDDKPQIEDFI